MLKLSATAMAMAMAFSPQLVRSTLGVLDARQSVSFFIEDGNGVPGYRDSDRELAKLAIDAWSRESSGKLKFTESKQRDGALIRLRWISPTEGLYGETQRVEVNGKPGAIVYLTCVHELGHAVGLSHTPKFADIMYYFGYGGDILDYFMRYRNKLQSRADIAKYSGLSTADVEVLRTLYRN